MKVKISYSRLDNSRASNVVIETVKSVFFSPKGGCHELAPLAVDAKYSSELLLALQTHSMSPIHSFAWSSLLIENQNSYLPV